MTVLITSAYSFNYKTGKANRSTDTNNPSCGLVSIAEPLTKESVDMVMALYNDGLGAWRNHANLTGPTEQPGVKSPIDDSINICHEARMRVHNVTDGVHTLH